LTWTSAGLGTIGAIFVPFALTYTARVFRQAIPRPAWARRIDPLADGPDVSDTAFRLTMGAVRDALDVGSAGSGASSAAIAPAADGGAAVLIVLVPASGDIGRTGDEGGATDQSSGVAEVLASSVLLIRRAGHLRANPGEIAFPGGRIEPGESPLAAALREAEEEVALIAEDVEVLGELATVLAPRRDVPIRPFVAVAQGRPLLQANPDEVDCVLLVPLSELMAPGRYWQEHWGRADDPTWVMHFFDLGEDVIWGATARMLHELFLRLFGHWCPVQTEES